MDPNVKQAIEDLKELQDDPTVPKNVKTKLLKIIETLSKEKDLSVAVHKALNELEDISNDINLEAYTRTQLWEVSSILEKIPN